METSLTLLKQESFEEWDTHLVLSERFRGLRSSCSGVSDLGGIRVEECDVWRFGAVSIQHTIAIHEQNGDQLLLEATKDTKNSKARKLDFTVRFYTKFGRKLILFPRRCFDCKDHPKKITMPGLAG